jgi:hypothetical protein
VSKTLLSASAPKIEVDQRSREARLRLAQVEGLLVPWVPPTRSWLREGLYWLCPNTRPRGTQEPIHADSRELRASDRE